VSCRWNGKKFQLEDIEMPVAGTIEAVEVFRETGDAGRSSRRSFLRNALLLGGATLAPSLWPRSRVGVLAEERVISPLMTLHTDVPRNAEPPLSALVENWITPTELFYVRSHAANPVVDSKAFRLSIEGMVETPLSLSLQELSETNQGLDVTATMCCAGNRRSELIAMKNIDGVPWGPAALGNGIWSGVRLAEVLKKAGIKEGAKHVCFEGLDTHEKKGKPIVFGGSIPLDRVFSDAEGADVLLATGMNGEPLTPDHGAPLRTVVPGYIGARSVKWLSKIIVSDRPSDNYYVKDAYRLITENTPEQWEEADILYELPLQSVIASVGDPKEIRVGKTVAVRGYALPTGAIGRTIQRVEISSNGGKTWQTATLDEQSRPYCWRLWKANVRMSNRTDSLLVRAIDSSWQMQPAEMPWNAKGYMYNAWHSVKTNE